MIEKKLLDEIDKIDIPEILSELVSIPSHESEQRIVEYIAQRLDKIDVKYEIIDVAPARQNLIASIGEGKSLIFNTHTDTVPPGNIENWVTSPFSLERKDDELFGLGSCDAKASLASMLVAFEVLAGDPSILNGQLILQAVCCEESRARGTLAETARGIKADAAIIGEPTELVPMIGHKGAIGLEITTLGKAAHGSAPQEGLNAITKMSKVILAMDILGAVVSRRHDPLLGNSSLSVTQIHGGQAPNVIPDSCVISVDRRLITGETVKMAMDEISTILKDNDPSIKIVIKEMIGIEPCAISPEEPIVKTVLDSIDQVTGERLKPAGFTACCDMWCLVQKLNIPTVILGPGKLSAAHKANESVSVKELYKAAKVYAAIALNWVRK